MAADVHVFVAAKIERDQPSRRKAGRDGEDTPQVGNEPQAGRNDDAEKERFCRPVQHNHQHQRADRIAEQDVAFPQEDKVRRTEHGQGQHAPQIDFLEFAPGLLGAHHHHRESHAEQQRKNRPELALHEIRDEPAGKPVGAGEAARHAFAEAGNGAIEELDVHQEDAEQRKPSDHIQGFDPLIRGNRRQIFVGHRRRC